MTKSDNKMIQDLFKMFNVKDEEEFWIKYNVQDSIFKETLRKPDITLQESKWLYNYASKQPFIRAAIKVLKENT